MQKPGKTISTVALLTIGTEVCAGDIVNTNAQWLASQLEAAYLTVVQHLSVRDEKQSILKALDQSAEAADLIVVTGGLGPTTDDITRDAIAAWIAKPLLFSQSTWQSLVERFERLQVPMAASNRQQCFFPDGANIVPNAAGTAAGFWLWDQEKNKTLICLPGPPSEVKAVWSHLNLNPLKERWPKQPSVKLWRWQCMGASESFLGEVVEKSLVGSEFTTGYRPHVPYVEIKVWTPATITRENTYLSKLEQEISRWVITRDDEDLVDSFWQELRRHHCQTVHIQDAVTHGELHERIFSSLRSSHAQRREDKISICIETFSDSTLMKDLGPHGPSVFYAKINSLPQMGEWIVETSFGNRPSKALHLRYGRRVTEDNQTRYWRTASEMTLASWLSELRSV